MVRSDKQSGDPLNPIAAQLECRRLVDQSEMPRFCGGAVGYLSYEAAQKFQSLLSKPERDELNVPEAIFMLCDTFLAFDHVKHQIKIISLASLEQNIEESYREAILAIDELVVRLKQRMPVVAASTARTDESSYQSNFTKDAFICCVRRIKEYIASGEAIQVVLSQRLTRETSARPFDIYRALRSVNPSPYMYYLDFEDFQIIGASPEILVRVSGNEVGSTRPLAGTRKRGRTPAEDKA